MDGVQLFGSSSILIIIWYMYRRFGFFWRGSSPRSPEARGDFKNPEGTPPFSRAVGPRAGEVPEGSQDKRIRKPKLEKGKERKLKRKVLEDIFVVILKIGFFLSG